MLTNPLDRGFTAAFCSSDDVIVDATALTRALLQANGITVHTGVEACALESTLGGVRVWACWCSVTAGAVILAVNGFDPLIDPYLGESTSPLYCVVLAIRPHLA